MLELNQSQKQTQTINTEQVLALNILAYSVQELNKFLQKEYYDNPLLEQTSAPSSASASSGDSMFRDYSEAYARPMPKEQNYGDDYYDREQYSKELSFEDPYTLEQMITDQLDRASYKDNEWDMILSMINNTDEKGFLTLSHLLIAEQHHIDSADADRILSTLQHLEPAGLFTSGLEDYLIFQLKENGNTDDTLIRLIREYLPDVLAGKFSDASRKLSVSTSQIRHYLHQISQLNPRPLPPIDTEKPDYLVPDLIIRRNGDSWEIQNNDGWIGSYDINSYYVHMLSTIQDPELKKYFHEKHKRAQFILECIEKRKKTIEKIALAILDYQRDYFLLGSPLRPMTLNDIAGITEVSESTVSRAIKDKTMQYKKIHVLKELFSVSTGSRADVSQHTVLQVLEDLIRNEDKKKPLSDNKLATLLTEQGIQVSRRAVTKYRESLHIPDSRHRI